MGLEGLENMNNNKFKMLHFFDKLYYSYYRFQERVGNSDVAPIMSAFIIAFILMLYYFSLFFFAILVFPKEQLNIDMNFFTLFSIGLAIVIIFGFSFVYLYKKRYKEVLIKYRQSRINRLVVILFPLIAFVLFNMGWILKMLQNQGKL